jgi:hypothetical protein
VQAADLTGPALRRALLGEPQFLSSFHGETHHTLKFDLYRLQPVYVPPVQSHLGCLERIIRLQPVPSGYKSLSNNDEEHVLGVFHLEDADVNFPSAYIDVSRQGQLLVQLVCAVLVGVTEILTTYTAGTRIRRQGSQSTERSPRREMC